MITRILHALTDVASSRRGKFVTLAVWLVATAVLVGIAPKLASVYDKTSSLAIPSSADSQVAQRLLLQEFPQSRGTPAILVFSDGAGLSTEDRARIQRVSQWLGSSQKPAHVGPVLSIWTVPQAASQLVSSDGTTMTIIATLNGSTTDPTFAESVKAIRAETQDAITGTPLEAHLTGPAGISTDAGTIFASTDVTLLLATVGLVLVLLIVVYRSPILALLPLIGVSWALQVANALLGLAAKGGLFSVNQETSSIMTVLLFGAGTDYTIFIASRFREELRRTPEKHDAMRATMRAVGEAITSSAGTVILAMLILTAAALSLYSSLGPTLAIAVAVMLLAGLTLVPALLATLGRAAYWPFIPRYDPAQAAPVAVRERGAWPALGRWVARHRVLSVVGSLLFLGILALGNLGLQPTYNLLTSFRQATDSGEGYALLHEHFPAGTLAPTTVLIQLRGAAPDAYQHLVQLDAITTALSEAPGVASVAGPTRPEGVPPTLAPAALQAAIAKLPPATRAAIRAGEPPAACQAPKCPPTDPLQAQAVGLFAASTQYVSPDDTTIKLTVVLQDDPYALAAINRIAPLRATVAQALATNGLGPEDATGALAGQTALLADTQQLNQRDTLLIVPAVLLLVGIVLALLLRSLIAPLYLLGAVTFNFLAALGICGFFFVRVEGQDGYNYAIPLYTFIFLVALGADYTIYLMSRVREEGQRLGLEAGVPLAVGRTGGVITSAGLILAGTFAVLTSLPINILYQLGICVAVGVLLDTFVVRGLLVPGLVLLLGRWNWWPGRLTPRGGENARAISSEPTIPLTRER